MFYVLLCTLVQIVRIFNVDSTIRRIPSHISNMPRRQVIFRNVPPVIGFHVELGTVPGTDCWLKGRPFSSSHVCDPPPSLIIAKLLARKDPRKRPRIFHAESRVSCVVPAHVNTGTCKQFSPTNVWYHTVVSRESVRSPAIITCLSPPSFAPKKDRTDIQWP